MIGPKGIAKFAADLMRDRLSAQLRAVEAADPDLSPGSLSDPRTVTFTEPRWSNMGIEQYPAVIVTARNAGSAVLQDSTLGFETYNVTYEVSAEVYLTHPDPTVADIARYSWALAIRQVWLLARAEGSISVLPSFAETYDAVVENTSEDGRQEWLSRALSVVQVVATEQLATGRRLTPVESVDVLAGYVEPDEELNVPIHPSLIVNDTPATLTP